MFGSYFFESTTQTSGLDGDFEIHAEAGRMEFGLGSRLNVESGFSFESFSEPGLTLDSTSISQEMSLGRNNYSTASEVVNYSISGMQVVSESNQWQWNAGSIDAELTTHEVSVSNDLNALDLGTTDLQPVTLPGNKLPTTGMNRQFNSFEMTGPLGSISLVTERIETSGMPSISAANSIQNTSVDWSIGLGSLQIEGVSNEVIANPIPGSPKEVRLENSWIERTAESSFSLDFGANPANPAGRKLGGLEVTRTSSSFSMGPGQLQLQTQKADVFAGFCGFDVSSTWMGQSQSTVDLSLAIA